MALKLKGMLDLKGLLNLEAGGGVVTANEIEVIVQRPPASPPHHGIGIPVPIVPIAPIDPGVNTWIFLSFNQTVTISRIPIVTQGLHLQGNVPTWPGMAQRSVVNPTITIAKVPMLVLGDQGITFPNGGAVVYSNASGQGV